MQKQVLGHGLLSFYCFSALCFHLRTLPKKLSVEKTKDVTLLS